MILICSPQRDTRPRCPFRGKFGDQVNGRSPRKLKSLIVVPYVAHLKIQVVSFNMLLISTPQRVPRPSCPFWGKFGRTGKMSSNKKAKIVDRGSLCNALKVQVLRFNMKLISSRQRVPRPSYPFRGKIGDQVKGRSPKKLKSLIVVLYVAYQKIQVLSCIMNLISSPQQAPRPSYPFRGKFGRSGKGSFTEKAKIVQRVSLCIALEKTCSKLQYDAYLISVACCQSELSISEKLREIRKRVVLRNS